VKVGIDEAHEERMLNVIATGPNWKRVNDRPGFGYDVDESAIAKYHADFKKNGPCIIYGKKFPLSK
jgi:L-alanine-DL-glutamate epimerase-like enolase superfamily enzyme